MNIFGFKKKPEIRFENLPKARDLLKDLLGETMNIYVGMTIGYLTKLGDHTDKDVNEAKEKMLEALQKYVQAEILLDRQRHGQEPSLAELAGLRLK